MPLHCQRQKPSGSWTVTDLLQSSAEDTDQLECMDLYFRLMSSNAMVACIHLLRPSLSAPAGHKLEM